jgi:ATP-dependent DNA helicase RecG
LDITITGFIRCNYYILGVLVVGIEDKTKNVIGINDPLAVEEKIANVIADCITPIIVPEIEIGAWRDRSVIVIKIFPSPIRPHFLKQKGIENGTYVRVGSTNRLADQALIKEMARAVTNGVYDEQVMPHVSSEALDFRAASEQFKPIKKLHPRDFESPGIVSHYRLSIATSLTLS